MVDTSTLERLVPDELLSNEATGAETYRLHLERYEFAASKAGTARSVLDIACGVGYGSRLLKDRLPAATITGVDVCADTIGYAKTRYGTENLSFVLADAMSFEAGPFDAVISLETIEHLPHPDAFIETIATRLLRPGGIFIGSVPVTPSMDANPHHLHDFTARSFRKLLEMRGLREFDCLSQIQPYSPMAVASRTETRMAAMRQNILAYYCRHPEKALLRAKSIIADGFCNKYLTIAAKSA